MKAIEMDAPGGTVRAQAGVLWAELDRATQASGLAVPGGTDSEVGIAGLTLGGGNGWLIGLYGATCDNLLAADVVMADGRSVSTARMPIYSGGCAAVAEISGSSPRSAIASILLVRR
jgi:FAD/FMN-containing dehydrogenase